MKRKTMSYAALLVGVISSGVSAQYIDFGMQCATGAFRACVSVEITLLYHPPGASTGTNGLTELVFRMANPQGMRGFPGNPTGLRGMSVRGLESLLHGPTGETHGYFRFLEGNAIAMSGLDNVSQRYDSDGLARVGWGFDNPVGLYGCDLPTGLVSSPWGYNQTCGGFVTYSTVHFDHLRFTKGTTVTPFWEVYPDGGVWDGPSERVGCTTSVDCVTVTPEPATLALMATGLAGIAGVRARRRRKKGSISSDQPFRS